MVSSPTVANHSVFPPGALCVYNALDNITAPDCPVTNDMISFLNLSATEFWKGYFKAYCAVGPPSDDGCPYGYCPNPDVAGRYYYATWYKNHGIAQARLSAFQPI